MAERNSQNHSSSGELSDSGEELTESLSQQGSSLMSGQRKQSRPAMGRPRAQLTPRMALYIPPHLQKQTQPSASMTKKTAAKVHPVFTPRQVEAEKHLRGKLEEFAKGYIQSQHQVSESTPAQFQKSSSRIRPSKPKLFPNSWTSALQDLLDTKTKNYLKYKESGCELALRESKKAKAKLRNLLRKARSKNLAPENVYENLIKYHQQFERSASPDVFRSSIHLENLSDDEFDEHMEDCMSARIERLALQNDWSEAMIRFIAKISMRKLSVPDVIKVEAIDSDEESGNRASTGRASETSRGNRASGSSEGLADQASLDASNNEYLNQQFLRRQHDYEREQKYRQISVEARTRRSSPETFDDSLREYAQSGNRKLNVDSSRWPGLQQTLSPPVDGPSPPIFPVHPSLRGSEGLMFAKEVPKEPFVDKRRLKIYAAPKEPIVGGVRSPAGNSSGRYGPPDVVSDHGAQPHHDEVYVRNYSHRGIEEYQSRDQSHSSSRRIPNDDRGRSSSMERFSVREKNYRDTNVTLRHGKYVREHNYGSEEFGMDGGNRREVLRKPSFDGSDYACRNYVNYPLVSNEHGSDSDEHHYPKESSHIVRTAPENEKHRSRDRREKSEHHRKDRKDRRDHHYPNPELHDEKNSRSGSKKSSDRNRDSRMDYHILAEARERNSHRGRTDHSEREHPGNLLKHDLERVKTRGYDSPERELHMLSRKRKLPSYEKPSKRSRR